GGALLGVFAGFKIGEDQTAVGAAKTDTGGETASGAGESGNSLGGARTYISRQEDFAAGAAATESIYAEDDNGPGAMELRVQYFIDRQLYGRWWTNGTHYRMGPCRPMSSDTHGRQEKMDRGEMFLMGIRRMMSYATEEYDDDFVNLDGEQQDEILKAFE